MSDEQRQFLMTKRQCLIMELGALEDLLGMERSIVPKRKRDINPPRDLQVILDNADQWRAERQAAQR
jgi:predicted nucleotide-binding protein